MKSFVLLFRMDITTPEAQPTAEQMATYMSQWMKWTDGISATGQLAGGHHLMAEGSVLRQNGASEGPYTVNKESVAGYIVINAPGIENALRIAQDCPILNGTGTSVEVREVAMPG